MILKIDINSIDDQITSNINKTLDEIAKTRSMFDGIAIPNGFAYKTEFVDIASNLDVAKASLNTVKELVVDAKKEMVKLTDNYKVNTNNVIGDSILRVDNMIKK